MVDQVALMKALSNFARILVTDYEVSDVLQDLVEAAPEVLGVRGAGVTLLEGDRLVFATALGEPAAELERIQERDQVGPCVDADRLGEPVLVADLRAEGHRWPALAEAAAAHGLHAAAGIPMSLGGAKLGALNLYAEGPRDWSEEEVVTARLLADMATAYMANASMLERSRRLGEQLQQALDTRVVIEQAKGILVGERRISTDAAFEVLRRHARSHNTSVRAVADAVVHLGLRP